MDQVETFAADASYAAASSSRVVETFSDAPMAGGFYRRRVTFTDAQIKAFPTSSEAARTLIPAPPPYLVAVCVRFLFVLNYYAHYTNISANGTWQVYGARDSAMLANNQTGPAYPGLTDFLGHNLASSGRTHASRFYDLPAGLSEFRTGLEYYGLVWSPQDLYNLSTYLYANNAGSNYTGGDPRNTLDVLIDYVVLPTISESMSLAVADALEQERAQRLQRPAQGLIKRSPRVV